MDRGEVGYSQWGCKEIDMTEHDAPSLVLGFYCYVQMIQIQHNDSLSIKLENPNIIISH